jgi:hypothetical protein
MKNKVAGDFKIYHRMISANTRCDEPAGGSLLLLAIVLSSWGSPLEGFTREHLPCEKV